MTSSTHNNNDYDPAAAVLLLQQQLLLRDLVLVSAILGIKCAAIAQAIGCLRVTTVQYCAPEDLLLDPPRNRRIRQASRQERNATPSSSSSSSSSSVVLTWRERLQRIQQNDVENIPIFLLLAAVYAAALTLHNNHHINLDHPASSWMLVEARPVLWVFGGARLLHTLCYLTKLQPHRTMAFATGLAAHYYVCGLLLRWAIVFGNINSRHNNSSAATTPSWFYHYLPVLVVLPLLAQMMYYVVESPVCLWRFFVPVVARDSRWKDDAKKQS